VRKHTSDGERRETEEEEEEEEEEEGDGEVGVVGDFFDFVGLLGGVVGVDAAFGGVLCAGLCFVFFVLFWVGVLDDGDEVVRVLGDGDEVVSVSESCCARV
jgi:hypothetical protein